MNCSTLSFFHACFLTYIHKLYIRWALLGYANTNTVKDISLYAHIFFPFSSASREVFMGVLPIAKDFLFFFLFVVNFVIHCF